MKNESHPIIKDLVKMILQKADQFRWSLQGFGMLRLYVGENHRVHVWDNSYAVPDVSELHTHPWDFKSLIVGGRIRNTIYEETDLHEGDGDCYSRQVIKCGPGGCLTGASMPVRLKQKSVQLYIEGDEYQQSAEEIHRSQPQPGTVTMITRTFKEDVDHAKVFWPKDKQWVSAEPRDATPDEVKKITQFALERWFS